MTKSKHLLIPYPPNISGLSLWLSSETLLNHRSQCDSQFPIVIEFEPNRRFEVESNQSCSSARYGRQNMLDQAN